MICCSITQGEETREETGDGSLSPSRNNGYRAVHMTNTKDKRIQIFETYPIPKAVFALVGPSILGMLVMLLYNLADTFFVGMLNDARQTAAVSLAAPVMLAFNAVNNLFGVGGSSLMGRALGRRDYDTVANSSAFSVWGAIAAGILFSALVALFRQPLLRVLGADADNLDFTKSYLFYTSMLGAMPSILNFVLAYLIRTEGRSLQSSIGTALGCVLNVILDPFFILPRFIGMGAAGAGLATLISNIVSCAYFFIYIRKKKSKSYVCVDPRRALPTRYVAREIFSVGIPSSIQNLLNVTGMTILNNFASAFGSAAVSAMGISHKVCMLPLYVSMGMASGANPLVAYNYGSGNYARSRDCVKFTSVVGVLFSAAIMAVFLAVPDKIMAFFIADTDIIAYGARFIRANCLGMPFLAMDFIGVGVYQAFGKGRLALLYAVARKLVLEIPALFVLNKFYPLYGLAYAQPLAEIILGTSAVFVLILLFKKLTRQGFE